MIYTFLLNPKRFASEDLSSYRLRRQLVNKLGYHVAAGELEYRSWL